QRSAQRDRRHGEDDRAEEQALDRGDRGAEARRSAGRDVDRAHVAEQQRAEGGRERGRELEPRIENERTRMPNGARADEEAAGAEAADEDREHRGRRRRARAENQPELAQPADLIDEGAEAGREEQRRDRPRAHLSASAPTRAPGRRRPPRPAARARRAPAGRAARR